MTSESRTSKRATLWRVLGVAGLAGVAATGVAVARPERRRQQLTPEQVRQRLLERHAALGPSSGGSTGGSTGGSPGGGPPSDG